jgi:hypothetical protein
MAFAHEAHLADIDLTADDLVLDHLRPERRSRLTLLLALALVVCLAGGAAIASALLVGGFRSGTKATGGAGASLSSSARQTAFEQGRQAGYDEGVAAARTNKAGAYAKSLAKAQRKGYKLGYAAGQDVGRRQGYSAGFQDGSGKYKAAVDAYTKLTKSLAQQAAAKPAPSPKP